MSRPDDESATTAQAGRELIGVDRPEQRRPGRGPEHGGENGDTPHGGTAAVPGTAPAGWTDPAAEPTTAGHAAPSGADEADEAALKADEAAPAADEAAPAANEAAPAANEAALAANEAELEANEAELEANEAELEATVVALTEENLPAEKRRRLLTRLVGDVRRSGVGRLFRPRAAVQWMADAVSDIAPRIPIRDLETLRRHHGGLEGDELAERLVRNAGRATAGVGAAGGGVASIEWVATPTLLSAPVLLAAETVAVVAIEMKLIGELHVVYGQPVTGSAGHRAMSLVQAWSGQRGVNPLVPGVGVATVLGTAARKELQNTLLRRFGRNLTTMGPLLTGAAVASYLNRRATRSLGDNLIKDLRKKHRKIIDS